MEIIIIIAALALLGPTVIIPIFTMGKTGRDPGDTTDER